MLRKVDETMKKGQIYSCLKKEKRKSYSIFAKGDMILSSLTNVFFVYVDAYDCILQWSAKIIAMKFQRRLGSRTINPKSTIVMAKWTRRWPKISQQTEDHHISMI